MHYSLDNLTPAFYSKNTEIPSGFTAPKDKAAFFVPLWGMRGINILNNARVLGNSVESPAYSSLGGFTERPRIMTSTINNLYNIYNQLEAINAADLDSFVLDDVISAQRSLSSAILRHPSTTSEDIKIKAKMLKINLEIECQTKGTMKFEDTEQKALYDVLVHLTGE